MYLFVSLFAYLFEHLLAEPHASPEKEMQTCRATAASPAAPLAAGSSCRGGLGVGVGSCWEEHTHRHTSPPLLRAAPAELLAYSCWLAMGPII